MKTLLKYLAFLVITGLVFYVIGCLFPFSILTITIDPCKPTSKGESVYYLICFLQVIMMILTALLAIFGDYVRQLLRHPSLSSKLRSDSIKEELKDPKSTQKRAKRFYNNLDIHNTGKQNASDCELILEKITYSQGNDLIELLPDETEISFMGGKNYISVNGKKSILLYELLAAEEQGQTKGMKDQLQPQLSICGVIIPFQYSKGKLSIFIRLNTLSIESKLIQIEITWDGVWENRSFDMDKHLKCIIVKES